MHPINVFLIILYLNIIYGKQWYSASIAETEKDPATNSEFSYHVDKFEAIPTFKHEKPARHRWRFEKTETTSVKSLPNPVTERLNYNESEVAFNSYLEHNVAEPRNRTMATTFTGTPLLPLSLKVLRKRCPSRARKNEVLMSGNGEKGRFLELFQVVEFERVLCSSSSGLEGVCLHEYECEISGGTSMGTCADGYGTCCVTLLPCDTQTSAQSGWFTNPGYPSPSADRLSCTLTLNKTTEAIVQIRLDFNIFELLPPTAGSCESDQFVVSGHNINNVIPILCGINNGQHIYIEVGDVTGPVYLTVQTVTADNRLFAIKVSQLTSLDELSAPKGCLQYYKEPEGYLESFNYKIRSNIDIPRIPSYLNNLNYAICIERAAKSCSTTYVNAKTMQIVNYDEDGAPVIPVGQAGVEIFNCPGDWLLIAATRLCGDRFNDGLVLQDFAYNAPVTDTASGPIVIWFKTDGGYVGRGFKLKYQQNNCTNS